jgi:hypothetical protein
MSVLFASEMWDRWIQAYVHGFKEWGMLGLYVFGFAALLKMLTGRKKR